MHGPVVLRLEVRTMTHQPTDLLGELREEREKHFRVGNEIYGFVCDGCGVDWPCSEGRALDCAIAAAELHRPMMQGYCSYCGSVENADLWPCMELEAMSAAFRGEKR